MHKNIGPYEILERLGEGGIAIVYLAQQTEPLRRHVALKMIKKGMDTAQVVKRFESERQALAVLEHPNIAQVFDAGVTDDGAPYFVMEVVRGSTIGEYCDRARLTTRQRIELFLDVCAAIQHAHIKGLIHRDIKPSNVLVAEQESAPVVKVIDFGIAKAVEPDTSDKTQLTQIGVVVGTPQFMSPEQLGGEPIDTRADVYSLGILLYELLVGATPIDLHGISSHALGYLIREKPTPIPSTRLGELKDTQAEISAARSTDYRVLLRELKGDLDWIIMKACAKDRELRYDTANAFANDLSRFLDHQPVSARPPSTGYIVSRFVRRNKLAVAAGALSLLAIIAGASAAFVGFMQARESERIALQEAQTAQQVSDFLVDLFEVSDPSEARGNSMTAREVLEVGAAKIDEELDDQPIVQTTLMVTMAEVYKNLGLYKEAIRLSERALEQNRALDLEPLVLADNLDQLGSLYTQTGDLDQAEAFHSEALDIRVANGAEPKVALVSTYAHLGVIEYLRADYDASENFFVRALDTADQLPERPSALVAELLGNIGAVHSQRGDYIQAEAYDLRGLDVLLDEFGEVYPLTATMFNNVALNIKKQGRFAEASEMYEKALKIYRQLYDDAHPNIANTLNNLALAYLEAERFEETAELQRESVNMFTELLGAEHSQVATAKVNLGRTYALSGRLQDAEKVQREALALQESVLRPGHARIATALTALAITLNYQERYAEAEELVRRAYDLRVERSGLGHGSTARAATVLGHALAGLGRFEEAETLMINGYETVVERLRANSIAAKEAAKSIVWMYEQSGRPELAEAFRQQNP